MTIIKSSADFLMKKLEDMKQSRHKIKNIAWSIFRAALLIGLAYVILYPVLYMISMGFRDIDDLYDVTVNWVPKHFTMDNFLRVWEGIDYPATLLNTLVISLGSTVLLLVTCSMAAYGLSRFRFRGHNIVFIAVLFTIIVPQHFFALASFRLFGDFSFFGVLDLFTLITGIDTKVSLIDTYWTFLLPAAFGIGIRSGLYIYIFHQFFKGLPKELEEAAYIDGCGFVKTFIKIILPSSSAVFITVFLFSFVWHWNDYQLSARFMGVSHQTLSSALVSLKGLLYELDANAGALASAEIDYNRIKIDQQVASLMVVGPVVLLYLVLQRYFTESIERTGLVG